jgi:hypothetical protein
MKYLLFISLCILSTTSFSMMCPANFNTIDVGDKLEDVLNQCGVPESRESSVELVTLSNNIGKVNNLQITNVDQKYVKLVKLVYGGAQPAMFIFIDGILLRRELLS